MIRMNIPRKRSPGVGALCREHVEAGAEDQPFEVWLDGRHVITGRSLYASALIAVTEEPSCRFTAWTPHHHAVVGPRVSALLEARAIDRLLRKEYGV